MKNSDQSKNQLGLFGLAQNTRETAAQDSHKIERTPSTESPLPSRLRPQSFADFVGHEKLRQDYPFLSDFQLPGLILWGPPGTGKTTLAHILAKSIQKELFSFNAVLGNLTHLRSWIQSACDTKKIFEKKSILLIDEIHRLNKIQQDALLPYVEEGDFILMGATTENPHYCLSKPLLSRLHVIELKKFSEEEILTILNSSVKKLSLSQNAPTPHPQALEVIAKFSDGDARQALNLLEIVQKDPTLSFHPEEMENQKQEEERLASLEKIIKLLRQNCRSYDRDQDRHYDVISAFIKSLRGSDPDSALLWLAVMLDGGEDPLFIARRLIIFASEDIGNGDPAALPLCTATLTALQQIGMPEGRIVLAQAVTYLASTVKCNSSYVAINKALDYVKSQKTLEVPSHLRSRQPHGEHSYLYPHDYPDHFIRQRYGPLETPKFYEPSETGREKFFKERLEKLWGKNNQKVPGNEN